MITCTRCGAQNEDDAKFCVSCGASLNVRSTRHEGTCFGQPERRIEQECFGLPYGGAILGIIFGAFIIGIGLSMLLNIELGQYIGPFIVVVIGILIIAGALYGLSHRRR
jgi:EamA domain-containing membrane protein RarD